MAMRSTKGNLHLEIQTSRRSPVGLLRTTYRDKKTGKYCHTQHGRITGCTLEQLKLLQLAFREKVTPAGSPGSFKIEGSREFGASASILDLAKELNLHRMLYSRATPWVDSVMAMIVGRLIYQGSKLSLLHHRPNTCLWDLCGVAAVQDVDMPSAISLWIACLSARTRSIKSWRSAISVLLRARVHCCSMTSPARILRANTRPAN